MEYNKKFIIKNSTGQLIFDFDYFIKSEYHMEFYKDNISVAYLALDKDVKIDFNIVCKNKHTTLIAFSIK